MTSVTDILKKHGKWIEASALIKKIVKANDYENPRQGWRVYQKAWKNKEIRKLTLPDRSVLVGLPEWPFPTTVSKKTTKTVSFKEAFVFRCFEDLGKVLAEKDNGRPNSAAKRLRSLMFLLPSELKDKLSSEIQKPASEWTIKDLENAIDKVSTLLHQFEADEKQNEKEIGF